MATPVKTPVDLEVTTLYKALHFQAYAAEKSTFERLCAMQPVHTAIGQSVRIVRAWEGAPIDGAIVFIPPSQTEAAYEHRKPTDLTKWVLSQSQEETIETINIDVKTIISPIRAHSGRQQDAEIFVFWVDGLAPDYLVFLPREIYHRSLFMRLASMMPFAVHSSHLREAVRRFADVANVQRDWKIKNSMQGEEGEEPEPPGKEEQQLHAEKLEGDGGGFWYANPTTGVIFHRWWITTSNGSSLSPTAQTSTHDDASSVRSSHAILRFWTILQSDPERFVWTLHLNAMVPLVCDFELQLPNSRTKVRIEHKYWPSARAALLAKKLKEAQLNDFFANHWDFIVFQVDAPDTPPDSFEMFCLARHHLMQKSDNVGKLQFFTGLDGMESFCEYLSDNYSAARKASTILARKFQIQPKVRLSSKHQDDINAVVDNPKASTWIEAWEQQCKFILDLLATVCCAKGSLLCFPYARSRAMSHAGQPFSEFIVVDYDWSQAEVDHFVATAELPAAHLCATKLQEKRSIVVRYFQSEPPGVNQKGQRNHWLTIKTPDIRPTPDEQHFICLASPFLEAEDRTEGAEELLRFFFLPSELFGKIAQAKKVATRSIGTGMQDKVDARHHLIRFSALHDHFRKALNPEAKLTRVDYPASVTKNFFWLPGQLGRTVKSRLQILWDHKGFEFARPSGPRGSAQDDDDEDAGEEGVEVEGVPADIREGESGSVDLMAALGGQFDGMSLD